VLLLALGFFENPISLARQKNPDRIDQCRHFLEVRDNLDSRTFESFKIGQGGLIVLL
jgi:hypothetical protein